MEELKESMYVRSKYGIDKITKINTNCSIDEKEVVYVEKKDDSLWGFMLKIEDIIKTSYNIIDLIEVGDVLVVDGIKYTVLQDKEHCNNILHIKTLDDHYSTIKYLFEQNRVESILTKEQFEREAYKL